MASINTEAISEEYLHVNSCGCQKPYGFDAGALRINGRIDYHVLYIDEGACFVNVDGERKKAPEGSVIFYPPGVAQDYKFYKDVKTTSYYIHFSGTACADLFEKFGFNKQRIFYIEKSKELVNLYKSLLEEFYLKPKYYEFSCSGILLNILTFIGRKIATDRSSEHGIVKEIREICKCIYAERSELKYIKDYADMCNMSESYFSHVFTEIVGVSPKKYIINAKIEMAKDLLRDTDFSIAQISGISGFNDQNYFSRMFKKYLNESPSSYRNRKK